MKKKTLRKPRVARARKSGIDISLLEERLRLTPTERVERHQRALEFAEEMSRAGRRTHGSD